MRLLIRVKVGFRVWFGVKVKRSLPLLPDFWSLSWKNTLAKKSNTKRQQNCIFASLLFTHSTELIGQGQDQAG